MYYPCSENKGADQLPCYCEADLRLFFRLCKSFVFSWGGSFVAVAKLNIKTKDGYDKAVEFSNALASQRSDKYFDSAYNSKTKWTATMINLSLYVFLHLSYVHLIFLSNCYL